MQLQNDEVKEYDEKKRYENNNWREEIKRKMLSYCSQDTRIN